MTEAPDGPDVGKALSKKIGPLPLGLWIVGIGGGAIIAIYLRRNAAAKNEPLEPVPADSTLTGQPNGVGQTGSGTGTGTGTTETVPTTNEQWGQWIIRKMIARGFSPNLVDSAVRKYLNGDRLTAAESAVIAEALVVYGTPPSAPPLPVPEPPPVVDPPPPPPPIVQPPTPPPPPPPVVVPPWQPPPPEPAYDPSRHWVYRAQSGDSYDKIAARSQREHGGKRWSGMEVYYFNLQWRNESAKATIRSRGPNLIYSNTEVWVPK